MTFDVTNLQVKSPQIAPTSKKTITIPLESFAGATLPTFLLIVVIGGGCRSGSGGRGGCSGGAGGDGGGSGGGGKVVEVMEAMVAAAGVLSGILCLHEHKTS